jgi:UDP-2,3-diacylglucosamine hydrolase
VSPGAIRYFQRPMDSKPFLIVSDVHLGAVPRSTERAFRDFLGHAAETASGLLINGDLFDFWFEYRTVMQREHYRVLARLAELVEGGVPVWFMGGNHDAWGGSFLRDEVGIHLLDGPTVIELAGRRALVVHGDGIGSGDLAYRALKLILRSPVTTRAFRQLHPDWGSRIARFVSTTEEKAAKDPAHVRSRAAYVQAWAEERLRADPALDLVIAGHVHLPTIAEIEPGRFYVNSGDWIHHHTYLALPAAGGAPCLRRWPVRGDAA